MKKSNFIEYAKTGWEKIGDGLKRKILGYDNKIMMVLVDFKKGAVGSLHKHPHRQVSYVVQGKFEASIDGLSKIIKEGDSFYVPPDTEHGVKCLEKGILIDVFSPSREDFLK
jgi:quercetin dioxygenase-like cupin family protein